MCTLTLTETLTIRSRWSENSSSSEIVLIVLIVLSYSFLVGLMGSCALLVTRFPPAWRPPRANSLISLFPQRPSGPE